MSQGTPTQPTAHIRFQSWEEFGAFLGQSGGARGLFVRADKPPAIGTEIGVHFVLPDGSELLLSGRVVHSLNALEAQALDEEPGMGVQFTHMSQEQGRQLQELMMKAFEASMAYRAYALEVIAQRRRQATEDLISILTHAEVDGQSLDDDELVMESLLILIGGDETTRHVISGGVEQLLRNRSQWELLQNDPSLVPQAVEEMIRWVSPIKNMCRTVVEDMDFHGASLKAGQKMMLLYESANRDESHFAKADVFDVRREKNDHLAFGLGTHFCLGANLARLEVRTMVEQLLVRLPDLALASDAPLRMREANFVSGAEEMAVTFSPTAPLAGAAA